VAVIAKFDFQQPLIQSLASHIENVENICAY